MTSYKPKSPANLVPILDVPEQSHAKLPMYHPTTRQPCQFDTSATPTYPRNSYGVAPPADHQGDESWWPDGLNEIDPRPRNVSRYTREALLKPFATRLEHKCSTAVSDRPHIDYHDYSGRYHESFYQQHRILLRQERARRRLAQAVATAVADGVTHDQLEALQRQAICHEAQKEFETREKACHKFEAQVGAPPGWSETYRSLVLRPFRPTEREKRLQRLDRAWAEPPPPPPPPPPASASASPSPPPVVVTRAPPRPRFPTVHELRPDPRKLSAERRRQARKIRDYEAQMLLLEIWDDAPLGGLEEQQRDGKDAALTRYLVEKAKKKRLVPLKHV